MTATVSAASLSHIIVSPLFSAGPQLGLALAAKLRIHSLVDETHFTAKGFLRAAADGRASAGHPGPRKH